MTTRAISPGGVGLWVVAAFLFSVALTALGLLGVSFYAAVMLSLIGASLIAVGVGIGLRTSKLFGWGVLGVLAFIVFALIAGPVFAADNTVSIPVDTWLNPALEFLGLIAAGGATWLVGVLVAFLPKGMRALVNTAVQTLLANWIRQAINYAIQQVEGFDKGKVISFSVGSSALATALRFLIDHGPAWLLKLAGGPDKIKAQILAALSDHGIVLDTGVLPEAVAAATASDPALAAAVNKWKG